MRLGDVLKGYRLVDLSKVMMPGDVHGPVGAGKRRLEIREFAYPPGETMHQVDMETHIGTHVEAPRHFVNARHGRDGKDISQLPLESLFGEAVLVNLAGFTAGHAITAEDVAGFGVRAGDIVFFGNGSHGGTDRPWITRGAAESLARTRIRMAGIDDSVFPEEPKYMSRDLTRYHTHDALLSNDIPFIEGLANLAAVSRGRFFFFGLVAPIARLEAFPIRAVAFIPPDGEGEGR
jgi:arylformamidase